MMVINDKTFDVRLYLDRTGPLTPGKTADEVPIRFLFPEDAARHVGIGKKFVLREMQLIGEGVVKRILMQA